MALSRDPSSDRVVPFRTRIALPVELGLASALTLLFSLSSCGNETRDVSFETPPVESPEVEDVWRPIYGEAGTALDKLRLRFQHIPVAEVNAGTDFAFLPNQGDPRKNEFLLLPRDRRLILGQLDGATTSVLRAWEFQEEMVLRDACAPTNVALDPNFESNGFIFVSYCKDLNTTRLVRYNFDREDGISNPSTIFETRREGAVEGWHRFGSLGFEEDGTLWMMIGDHEVKELGQDASSPLGSLIRIVPNRETDGEGHAFPSGNWRDRGDAPQDVHPAVHSIGLRSPWRATRDSRGWFFVGDVGDQEAEEVNLISDVGQNFGWSLHEGPCETQCEGLLDPIAFYDFDDEHPYVLEEPEASGAMKRAIWVSEIYEAPARDRYQGLMDRSVLFGDLFTGAIRSLRVDEEREVNVDIPAGALPFVTTMKLAPNGYLYALDLGGQIHAAVLDFQ